MTGDPLVYWLLTEAHDLAIGPLIASLGERLCEEGVPAERIFNGTLRLHPLQAGESTTWRRGRGLTEVILPHSERGSVPTTGPMALAMTGEVVVLPLVGLPRGTNGLSVDLWDEAYTDLLAMGFPIANLGALMTFATKSPGGFRPEHLARLRAIGPALGAALRILHERGLSRTLLQTYLGANVGARVLAGQIRRGDGQTITAAVWFSDLRGFTALSDTLPRDALLGMLGDAFEAQVAAIDAHGGEVLKFIGDGMLAIFAVGDERTADEACRAALAASRDFAELLATVNAARVARGALPIGYGLALHYGDVMYGNIGAPGRLDFTVIGPAVNLAARLEGISAKLGREVVLSRVFADRCGTEAVSAGRFALKGLVDEVEVFVPA